MSGRSRQAAEYRRNRSRAGTAVNGFDVQVEGADAVRVLAAAFRRYGEDGKGLKKELTTGLRDAMKPMLADARKNAKSIPTHGTKSTGLRKQLARATKIQVSMAKRDPKVRMFTDPKKLPFSSAANLMDGTRKWRHPVFGDTTTWVEQESHPFFKPAVKKHLGRVRKAVGDALESVADKILEASK